MYSEAKLAFFQCTVVLFVMSLLFASLLYDGKNIYVCVREQHMYMITFILSKSCEFSSSD
jgi:hypothetical protein